MENINIVQAQESTSKTEYEIELEQKVKNNEKLIRYAQDKFEVGAFVYLTKTAYNSALDEVGECFHRGPWRIEKLGSTQDQFKTPYMGFFNPTAPSWDMAAYIDYDTQIEDWLTSDEYHIEQMRERLWEQSFYSHENSVFLNSKGLQDKSKIDRYDDIWDSSPHLWIPDVGDEIFVKRSSHHVLSETYKISCPPFVRCLVLEIEKMSEDNDNPLITESWNPYDLPTLYVKPIQFDSEINPIGDVDPKLCYPAPPEEKSKRGKKGK